MTLPWFKHIPACTHTHTQTGEKHPQWLNILLLDDRLGVIFILFLCAFSAFLQNLHHGYAQHRLRTLGTRKLALLFARL